MSLTSRIERLERNAAGRRPGGRNVVIGPSEGDAEPGSIRYWPSTDAWHLVVPEDAEGADDVLEALEADQRAFLEPSDIVSVFGRWSVPEPDPPTWSEICASRGEDWRC